MKCAAGTQGKHEGAGEKKNKKGQTREEKKMLNNKYVVQPSAAQ